MKKNELTLDETRDSFFSNFRREEDLDEQTFDMWKGELQNQLPGFWEQMNRIRSRMKK